METLRAGRPDERTIDLGTNGSSGFSGGRYCRMLSAPPSLNAVSRQEIKLSSVNGLLR
jgi:hypothetical protein